MFNHTCIVCKKRFGFLESNYARLYRGAEAKLSVPEAMKHLLGEVAQHVPVVKGEFVCEECAYKAATAVCPYCHERSDKQDKFFFVHVGFFSPYEYDQGKFDRSKAMIQDLKKRIIQLSNGRKRLEDSIYICDACRYRLITEAMEEFLQEMKQRYGHDVSQQILLFKDVPQDNDRCLRCGALVSEDTNYAEHLKILYDDEFYRFPDHKHECRAVISEYLKAKAICPSCCWQLRPEHVREDYIFREKNGWMGGTEGMHLSQDSLAEVHRFDLISISSKFCNRRDFENAIRERALKVGANGYVLFACSFNAGGNVVGGGAVPVFVKRNAGSNDDNEDLRQINSSEVGISLPKNVIIDGSNIIRFKDGGSVNGLATSISALKDKGCQVRVFLDANILHVLEDNGDVAGKTLLEKLLSKSSDTIKMVPAGSVADEFILLCANRDGSHVLSNDRYEPYVERYPWLKNKRTHKFMFMDGRLMIPDFGIDVEVK